MAKKQIHELSSLGRVLTGTDMIAVDTGSATRKAYPYQIKAGVIRDSNNGEDVNLSYSASYLAPAEGRPVYIAGMQRDANNVPIVGTIANATVKTMLGVNGISYTDVGPNDVTIGTNGWVNVATPSSGTPVFAYVANYTAMPGTKTALAIVGNGSNWYLTGAPGAVVTGLVVRYFFIS